MSFWGKVRVGWFERIALKHVYYHVWNRWPVQVQCMKQGTQSRCTGTTLREGVGREVGGGTHVRPPIGRFGWAMKPTFAVIDFQWLPNNFKQEIETENRIGFGHSWVPYRKEKQKLNKEVHRLEVIWANAQSGGHILDWDKGHPWVVLWKGG